MCGYCDKGEKTKYIKTELCVLSLHEQKASAMFTVPYHDGSPFLGWLGWRGLYKNREYFPTDLENL